MCLFFLSFLKHEIIAGVLPRLRCPLWQAKAKSLPGKIPLPGGLGGKRWIRAGLAARVFVLKHLVEEISYYNRSDQIPSKEEVLTQHIYTSFLIRMRKKKKKPGWRVQVNFGDAQSLFRKSCGFSVFHMSFSEPQTPLQVGSWGKWGWNKTQTELLGASWPSRSEGRAGLSWDCCWASREGGLLRSIRPTAREARCQEARWDLRR